MSSEEGTLEAAVEQLGEAHQTIRALRRALQEANRKMGALAHWVSLRARADALAAEAREARQEADEGEADAVRAALEYLGGES